MHFRILIFVALKFLNVICDDSQAIINGKKALHVVEERFLSVSIDPAILFCGLNFGQDTLKLAQHLAPSYIRIAGPSTDYLNFSEDETKSTDHLDEDTKSLDFTPSMWSSLNEWVKRSNFTPVFALNDKKKINKKWDPKSAMKLLEITSKMNANCYWQLGYEPFEKSERQYQEDLSTLRHILDAFPARKDNWKVVGSDFSGFADTSDVLRRRLEDLKDVDAVLWEASDLSESEIFTAEAMNRLLVNNGPKIPIWKSAPKTEHPVSFAAAIDWAVQIGEAAKNGYNVIYRQPRLHEMFTDTAAYWVTYLHKNLMGKNVLDVKSTSLRPSSASTYAHCSKNQNSYPIRGAMTIMVVNNATELHKTSLVVAGTQMKSVEVKSYILTSPSEDSFDTYLNGEKLSTDNLQESGMSFRPKLRRAKAITHLSLLTPPKSVAFYILPGARIPICVSDEDETKQILEEIHQVQNVDFPEEETNMIYTRVNRKSSDSLSDVYNRIEQEMKEDEQFYKDIIQKPSKKDTWKGLLGRSKEKESIPDKEDKKPLIEEGKLNEVKKFFKKAKDRIENLEIGKSKVELPKFELPRVNDMPKLDMKNLEMPKMDIKNIELPSLKDLLRKDEATTTENPDSDDLSSHEILKLLTDKAKAKLERRVGLANADFDDIFNNAFKAKIRTKRRGSGHRGAPPKRPKRDINLALLDEKAKDGKARTHSKYDINATIKQSHHSDEQPTKKHGSSSKHKTTTTTMAYTTKQYFKHARFSDVFAEMADDKDAKISGLGEGMSVPLKIFAVPRFTGASTESSKKKKPNYVKDDSDEKEDDVHKDVSSYHDFHETFGDDIKIVKSKDNKDLNKQFWEFGETGRFPANSEIAEGEFIINRHGGDDDVKGTIEKLENYLNNKKLTSYNKMSFASPYELEFGRFKRRSGLEDSKLFKNLGLDPIAFPSIDSFKLSERFKDGENFDKRYEPQIRYLKSRLAHHKKIEEAQNLHGLPKLNTDDLQRKLKDHFDLQSRLRLVRSPKTTSNEAYIPNINIANEFLKNYETKFDKIKEWKPEDILQLPKRLRDLIDNKDSQDEENSLQKINKRVPRHVDGDINSVENAIDDFLNVIQKDTKFIKPMLDRESGEYTIVFPTKDKISLIQSEGEMDIKLHKEGATEGSTCATEDDFATTTDAIVAATDEIPSTLADDDDDVDASTTQEIKTTSQQHVQKISKGNREHEFIMFDKLFDAVFIVPEMRNEDNAEIREKEASNFTSKCWTILNIHQ